MGTGNERHVQVAGSGYGDEVVRTGLHELSLHSGMTVMETFKQRDNLDDTEALLCADYIDILLLHRPDALVEAEEVARAFDELSASGKVRAFGVSNQTPNQIELLRKHVKQLRWPYLFHSFHVLRWLFSWRRAGKSASLPEIQRFTSCREHLPNSRLVCWNPFVNDSC